MILRRVAKSIRARDWFSFSIEFAIVVAGVFIGIQVANWNADRLERSEEAGYVLRLAADLRQDIRTYDAFLEIYRVKQETILALRDALLASVVMLQLDLDFWLTGGYYRLNPRRVHEPKAQSQGQLHRRAEGVDRPGAPVGGSTDLRSV